MRLENQIRILHLERNSEFNKEMLEAVLVDTVVYNKEILIAALEQGYDRSFCGKRCEDVITGEFISPSFSIKTDGTYCWRSDLSYYVKKYNIRFDAAFLRHMGAIRS